MVIRRRVTAVIALSVLIFSATVSVLVGLGDAPSAFAASEGYVIASADAPTIFSSRVDMDMARVLEGMENITGASPEVFAFSSWDGHSFVVRGVDWDRVRAVPPSLTVQFADGSGTLSAGCAIVGHRLADKLDLPLPGTVPLAGSYDYRVEVVKVLGTFRSDSPLDDEMLVSSEVARSLSGMAPDEASIIRVSTSSPAWLESLLEPDRARFAIYDLSASDSQLVPGEECEVTVAVRNWGTEPGSVTVSLRDQGESFHEETVSLNGSGETNVSATYSSDVVMVHEISATISGDFAVTLSVSVSVVTPYLVASFHDTVALGSSLEVALSTYSGDPAPGVGVTLLDSASPENVTDAFGRCALPADEEGTFTLEFDTAGTEFDGMPIQGSSRTVEVVDTSEMIPWFLPVPVDLSVDPESPVEGDAVTALVTVENRGSMGGTTTVNLTLDGMPYSSREVYIGPAETVTVSFELLDLDPSQHVVQAGSFSESFYVAPWYSDDPELVQLVIRYGGSATFSSAGAIPIYEAAKISEGNIALALFALGVVAALLSTLAIVSAFSKEVSDGRKRLGIIRALGASRDRIRAIVFREALGVSLIGSSVGVASGLLVAVALARSDMFVVFGHVLELDLGPAVAMLIFAGAVAISLVSALASAELAVRETAMTSIRDLPEEDGQQPEDPEPLIE